jgi:cytochrome b561
MSSKMPEQELYCLATNRVAKKKGGYIHFAVYLAVTVLLVVIWFVTGHSGDSFSWFVFLFSVIAAYSEYELTYP